METSSVEVVEVRCPAGPQSLLMKMRTDPDGPPRVSDGNLLMLNCRDCTKKSRQEMLKAGLSTNFRIIHCFDFTGEFVESVREALP